jgi:hypothetical protein
MRRRTFDCNAFVYRTIDSTSYGLEWHPPHGVKAKWLVFTGREAEAAA